MLWVWVLDVVGTILDWVTGWFPANWVIPYPAGLFVQIPVPGGLSTDALSLLLVWTVLIGGALIVGRFLTWIYRLIPTNG